MNNMIMRLQGERLNKTDHISLIFTEAEEEIIEIFPLDRRQGNFRQRSYNRNRNGYSLTISSLGCPTGTKVQSSHC